MYARLTSNADIISTYLIGRFSTGVVTLRMRMAGVPAAELVSCVRSSSIVVITCHQEQYVNERLADWRPARQLHTDSLAAAAAKSVANDTAPARYSICLYSLHAYRSHLTLTFYNKSGGRLLAVTTATPSSSSQNRVHEMNGKVDKLIR